MSFPGRRLSRPTTLSLFFFFSSEKGRKVGGWVGSQVFLPPCHHDMNSKRADFFIVVVVVWRKRKEGKGEEEEESLAFLDRKRERGPPLSPKIYGLFFFGHGGRNWKEEAKFFFSFSFSNSTFSSGA